MISKKLKYLRKQHKITQFELSKKLGISRAAIASYESRNIIPSVEVLIKMSNVFDVPLDYFYDDESIHELIPELFMNAVELSDPESIKKIQLMYQGKKIDTDNMKKILEYIHFLLSINDNK